MQTQYNNIPKFGIDVDGVLRDIIYGMLKVYNRDHHTSLTRNDITHYSVYDQFPNMPQDQSQYFFSGDNAQTILLQSPQIKHSLQAFNILSSIGNPYIITSQYGYDNISHTIKWLHKHNFNTDQICFLQNKSMITDIDYIIDDNPDNLFNHPAKHKILIDAPYNRHIPHNNPHNIIRHKSLLSFAKSLTTNQMPCSL